jgi:hypothetical protein
MRNASLARMQRVLLLAIAVGVAPVARPVNTLVFSLGATFYSR